MIPRIRILLAFALCLLTGELLGQLVSVEVTGPSVLFEGQSAAYRCLAKYVDGGVADVTASAAWSQTSSSAVINAGLLTAFLVESDQQVTVVAAYNEAGLLKIDAHNVLIKNVDLAGAGTQESPFLISNKWDLLYVGANVNDYDKHFQLAADINLEGITNHTAIIASEDVGDPFTGVFDGAGHVISNLYIEADGGNCMGLFGINSGVISNLGVVGVCIMNATEATGGICGVNLSGSMVGCYSSGTISGEWSVGGLCGVSGEGAIVSNCFSSGVVFGEWNVGGLCGYNDLSTIVESHSGCAVIGMGEYTGGLCGYNGFESSIENCYSSGSVSGYTFAGGLCGVNSDFSVIRESFSVSPVNGEETVGGFCGANESDSVIIDCYAFGDVSGFFNAAGFCGLNAFGSINNCYSAGSASIAGDTRGFCAYSENYEDINGCFYLDAGGWDEYAVRLDETEFLTAGSYYGFDFTGNSFDGSADIWAMVSGFSPRLSWQSGNEPRPSDCPHDLIGPWSTAAAEGSSATLSVSSQGENLSYQWYVENEEGLLVPVAGATGASLTTLPLLNGEAVYWVVVFNENAFILSQPARVVVGHEIYTLDDLQKVGSGVDGWDLDDAYVLMNDIDASETRGWNYDQEYSTEKGFIPIGGIDNPFAGVFDGNGHIIFGLYINSLSWDWREGAGLFGNTGDGAVIQNVGIVAGVIKGRSYCGALVGRNSGRIANCFAACLVEGSGDDVGGLIGSNTGSSDGGLCEPESGSGGSVYNCYSIGPVNGEWDTGSFIGDNRGAVVNSLAYLSTPYRGRESIGFVGDNSWGAEIVDCYQPTESCSRDQEEEAFSSRSISDLQRQSTYAGWNFDNIWTIQEGRGTAYLKQFAEGRDLHTTVVPEVTAPGNQNPVDSILPEFAGSVDSSSGDFVNAIWQISTSFNFADAKTWMGCNSNCYENAILNSSFTSKMPPMDALDYNHIYFVRFTLQTAYGAWTAWSVPSMFVVSKPNNPMQTGKQNLEVALGAAALNGVLLGDKLREAAADFSYAVTRNPADYEARIFSAVSSILELTDNREFRDLIAEFGYTFGDSLCGGYTGMIDLVSAPLPNECVDRIAAQCEPVLESALADLEVIPTNWPGSVTLSSEEFNIDQTVLLDRGDVLFLRSMLKASQAALSLAQAYDVTLNYANTNIFLPEVFAPIAAITLDGNTDDWTDVPEAVKSDDYQLETVKIAYSNDMAYLLFKMAEDTPSESIRGEVEFTDGFYTGTKYFSSRDYAVDYEESPAIPFGYRGFLDGAYDATIYYNGSIVEVAIPLEIPVSGALKITLSDYELNYYKQTPPHSVLDDVVVDGNGVEWEQVPEQYGFERDLVEWFKTAQTTNGTFCMLVKCHAGEFDYLDFDGEFRSLTDGSSDWFYRGNVDVNYGYDNNLSNYLVEISVTLPESMRDDQICLAWFSIYGEFYIGDDYAWRSDYYRLIDWMSWSESYTLKPVNAILPEHPDFLRQVRNAPKMDLSRTQLSNAFEIARLADRAVIERTDNEMHFIEYDPLQFNEQKIARDYMNEIKESLNQPHSFTVTNYTETAYLGAIFEPPYLLRDLLPQLTDDNELIDGTIPDPTVAGFLPEATGQRWHDELYGRVPMARKNIFVINGQRFSTGGYAFWNQLPDSGSVTNSSQSGMLTNMHVNVDTCSTWLETSFEGPGTLNFSWATTNAVNNNNFLCLYVDGVRQYGALRGDHGWGPRQIELGAGAHVVRWTYAKGEDDGLESDGGMIANLNWSGPPSELYTLTPTPVPYSWLDQYTGLVLDDAYEQAAAEDQDGDGMLTWQEYVAGTVPTDKNSRFIATIESAGSDMLIGWEPDLRPNREYEVEGKENLADDWAPANSASRFFKVKVRLP